MKNIVNRALVAKKKQFQSKSVPRGTRTIWRYLGALFLLFTFAIGNVWADSQTYSFASSAELSNFTYTAGDASDTWNVCTSKTNSVEPRDGGFVQYKCGKSNKIATFVTASSFDNISNISFYIASSDKGKTQVKIEVSSKADFSSDVTEIVNATGGLSGLGISSPSNNTWYSVSKSVASKSGYVRFTMTASSSGKYWSFDDIVITYTPSSGGDPVCPSGLTISSKDSKTAFTEGDAIELTASLTAGNGAITYQWYKGGTAEANKLTGKTAAKLEIASCVEGDAGDYYCVASKSDCSNAVNAEAFTITVAHNPCAMYFWFFSDADQTANGKTNATSVFSNMAGGGSNLSGSITIDETTYNVTRRTGDTDPLGGFTVPANKAATFYALAVSSGDGARKIVLTNTTTSATYEADVAGGNTSYKRVQIDNIAPGTYSIGKSGGNTRLGMVALKVCDATFRTITLEYADGATPDGSIDVIDGTAATKPADPTWAHHRFDGWYNGSDPYVWTANVTSNLTLTAHWTQLYTVTYAKGDESATGDAPTQVDKAAGETFKVAANTFAVAGKDFDKWNDGTNDYNPDDTYTVGTENVVLTAQWKTASAKYTVIFKDGDETLGTKQFDVASNPSDADIEKTKPLYAFAAWQKDAADIALDAAFWATVAKDAEVTLTARYEGKYASSINVEQWVLDNGAGKGATTKTSALLAEMGTKNYLSNITWENKNNELDTLDDSKTDGKRNYAYLGLKVKKDASNVRLLLQDGKSLKVKFGNVAATPNIKIGDAAATEMTITDGVYSLDAASGDREITISTTSAGAVVFKQIMIDEPIADVVLPAIVTLDANGGTYTGESSVKYTGTALVIGDATPADEYQEFAGWFDGDDQIDATAYVPTKNVTLVAHYSNKKYTVTYEGGEGATGTMNPVAAAWDEDYTALACGFDKENHSFSKWTVEGVTGVTEIAAGSSFVMPKGNVTLTAQWVNEALVARIGENYYESLPLAVAAAIASEETTIEIQLLAKDGGVIEGSGVKIPTANKTITIDFNGMKYIAGDPAVGSTGTETQAFQLLKDNNITLKNGAIACKAGSNVKMLIQNYSNLTLKNIRLEGENLNIAASSAYTLSNNNGAVVIGNGTEVIAKEGGVAFDVCYYASYPSVSVTVLPGASIDGKIEMSMSNNKQGVEENCQLIITGGEFENFSIDHTNIPEAGVNAAISAGTFDAPVENLYCADGFVPTQEDPVTHKYTVEPKEGVEIIGVVTTGGTNKTVTGLYKGDASVNLDDNQKIGSGKYIYVTLASGYTFEETDVLVVDLKAKSDLSGGTKALEITTGVGNIDGSVWKSIAYEDYTDGENTISLEGIADGQTSIGLKRSANQNAWVNGLKVYRPMNPILTAITINGEDAVKGTGNTFTITLPEEGTDLAALTVVPTIIRNAAHATTPEAVISNSGAWAEGANTYRVMDKDGDYTDYTITITLQGEAPAPVIATQPAGVAYCAGSEPTLTVEATGNELHYAWFKEAGETDAAVGEDAASYTIASAGTYYVVVTNHVDGKLDASVTSANADVTLNVAAAITTQPTNKRDVVAGSEVTLSVEATNATGYQWYSCEDAEKANASAISGADAANYVFNCSANAFYYCVVGNACGDDITSNVVSVKLEPEGCNVLDGTIPSAAPYIYDNGEWTLYAVTSGGKLEGTSRFDDDAEDFDGNTVNAITYGRVGMTFAKDVESLTIYATSSSSDRAISSIKVTTDDVTTGTPSYSDVTFTASAEKLGKKDSSSPYRFVLEANNMLLEAGKKYWLQFSGTVSAFKICYSEALAMPILPTLANQELCAGAAYETFDATITNAAACEGTVSYAWYSTDDTENPVAETATYTPTEDAIYYVVVKHVKAGHMTRVAQSAELTVAHFAAPALVSYSEDVFQHMGTAAELSVVATGSGLAYAWYTCDVDGSNADVISGAETNSYAIASIAEGVQYYKVVISNNCDESILSHIFKVEGWDQLEQVDVTASTVWDMTNVSEDAINLKNLTPSKQNVHLLLANIEGVNNNASFNSQALMFEGQHIGRTSNNVKHLAGRYVQFNVTVPGMVSVTFASNDDNKERTIAVNGKKCTRDTTNATYLTYDVAVEPGSVEIIGYEGESANQYVRISKIEFKAEDNYHRSVNPAYLGTLCWTNNAVLGGATLYEFAGKNEYNYLVFDEVAENRLEAGKPYIFMPENGNTLIKVYNTDDAAAKTESDLQPVNHMYGTVEGKTLVPGQNDNMYYFSASHIWAVKDFTVSINIPANCCYVDYVAVLNDSPAPAPAPGRRRVAMGVQGTQVATGCENLNVSDKPVKMIINGQLFILRGEKMYDAKGQLVK